MFGVGAGRPLFHLSQHIHRAESCAGLHTRQGAHFSAPLSAPAFSGSLAPQGANREPRLQRARPLRDSSFAKWTLAVTWVAAVASHANSSPLAPDAAAADPIYDRDVRAPTNRALWCSRWPREINAVTMSKWVLIKRNNKRQEEQQLCLLSFEWEENLS
jgi:hypothetical protein